ncbi:MAG TPA: hypothetical protein K8U78_05310 [Aeriscardovia aeriphila]|uniref:Uncharacterized protein n=1 Tax=Aeriscardovia aeriphila TaxID=218139 RepID=A0A921FV31_9BIFI|nr:hypothetical protein [Aeriscardovia aeriphila]
MTNFVVILLPEFLIWVATAIFFWLQKARKTGNYSSVKKVGSTILFLALVITTVEIALH